MADEKPVDNVPGEKPSNAKALGKPNCGRNYWNILPGNYLKKYCFVQLKDQSTARSQNLLGWFFYLGNIDGLPSSEYIEKRLQKPNISKSY